MKPAALDKLHDFYQPPGPSWMPQTIGWYIVFGLLVLLAAWAVWRIVSRWRHNRYRREALRELESADISGIPALLKRTALAAWPREQVASLTGKRWLRFLEQTGGAGTLARSAGARPGADFLDLDYRGAILTPEEEKNIRQAASNWIRRHRVRV
jgi:hypothetical protein